MLVNMIFWRAINSFSFRSDNLDPEQDASLD